MKQQRNYLPLFVWYAFRSCCRKYLNLFLAGPVKMQRTLRDRRSREHSFCRKIWCLFFTERERAMKNDKEKGRYRNGEKLK